MKGRSSRHGCRRDGAGGSRGRRALRSRTHRHFSSGTPLNYADEEAAGCDRPRHAGARRARQPNSGAATRSPPSCAGSTSRTSRSCRARATAACTTASSTISAIARPQIVLTLHEENTVAIAHGYAKASGRMMAAAMHANVGLMRAVMAVYNAWCDRAPVMMLGATGPWDAARRRPWIDWIHTSADQGALVRDFTKWDNQPGSVGAAVEAILRAAQIARTAPQGPVYVNLDDRRCRKRRSARCRRCRTSRATPRPRPCAPRPISLAAAARLLSGAARPAHARRPLLAQPRGLERARRAGREARHAGADQHQAGRGVPDRSPAACRAAGGEPDARGGKTGRAMPTSSCRSTGWTSPAR